MKKMAFIAVTTAACLALAGCDTAQDHGAYKKVAGNTYDGNKSYGLTYECGDGYLSVDLPQGQTVNQDGSQLSLTVGADQASSLTPVSTLTIQLASNYMLPAVIVTGSDYMQASDVYNQTPLDVNIEAGGSGTYLLDPSAYMRNYQNSGIAMVTLCLQRTSSE